MWPPLATAPSVPWWAILTELLLLLLLLTRLPWKESPRLSAEQLGASALPATSGRRLSLHHTVCMSARHYIGLHYNLFNLYNLYGLSETSATNAPLQGVGARRPFITSRSSFPGQGHYGGHWTGHVCSHCFNMWHSTADSSSRLRRSSRAWPRRWRGSGGPGSPPALRRVAPQPTTLRAGRA
ncbi:uncharacterized protein LOC126994022 isoform X1 [Eriocheir sinensis]|uniref:uncharacterized protein LOC126994022 isoform X1 n=1 Tax=Eriocheir sinensis TaxID=95602 RepID=UPI0021C6AB80|nr:uncharacterized protein LOC126994022 isoform X1 [Eriocheir sinensis]